MSKKIIIVGALGYLGSELCKIYSGESWKNKIIAIDSRFISEKVNQLSKWNIEFFQGHILDKTFIKKHLYDADVVHHLAGVTDVAYVKTEANSKLDNEIKKVAIDGTNNILESISKKCKLIFPSTHVIYEGLNEAKFNISEKEQPKPILMYARSKHQNEKDIISSNKKYIILRLGSVYGYSTDTMRINIMPNLFSKITSQNGTIKLFAGGKQLKSLVNVQDVVRCMKFVEEKDFIKNEIFNLVNEQTTVKEVALLCKKINPKVKIVNSRNEIPNLGYTLSNKKLKKVGFAFLYNLENSLRDMIEKWSYKKKKIKLEKIYKGENEFIDFRGKISNFELTESINLIGYIESKKRTIRANHYHPIQEQKCLLIKGQFISIYKSLLNKRSHQITHLVNEGDLIVTKPNVAHAMVFTKDSIFLNLVRGEREHKNYGITHTIPYRLIDKDEANKLVKYYRMDCRCCGNLNLKRVLSLGSQPLANNLLKTKHENAEKYPLELNFCEKCSNAQLSVSVDAKKMFNKYYYLSSTSEKFRNHFNKAASKYIKQFNLKKSSKIIDIGSNDGIGLVPFKEKKFQNLLGIEPAKNLCEISRKKGIQTINSYFNSKTLKKIKYKADLILASNVFAHSDNLKEMANCMDKVLSNKGIIVIEVQYILNTLKDLTFDNIYHEHYNYWSLTSLQYFFNNLDNDLFIFDAEKIDTHGGSIRVYLAKNKKQKIRKNVKELIKIEDRFGIKNYKTYLNFSKKVEKIKENILNNILKIKKTNIPIIGYGAPAKATTLLNFLGISEDIDFIVEDNDLKKGKFIPGVNIPIKGKKSVKDKNNHMIVLAWNFFKEIKKNNKNISNKIINIKSLQ